MAESKLIVSKRMLILLVTLAISIAIVGAYFGSVSLNKFSCPSGTNLHSFLIISDSNGFNDSKDHPLTLTAQKNYCVLITLENTDIQTHGIAVKTYAPDGITVRPGETKSLQFLATMAGQFNIWEPVSSTLYILDSGLLNVTSS